MNYIGSKYSLRAEITALLDKKQVPPHGIAIDLFAGTGAVAQLLKQRGHQVYANDWQRYACYTNMAFIAYNELPRFERLLAARGWQRRMAAVAPEPPIATYSIHERRRLDAAEPCAQVLQYLDQLPGRRGLFYETYCQGGTAGRQYYAHDNGLRIQAIRDQIADWHQQQLLSEREQAWLVACLIEAADRVANTASVYGAYLKHIKKPARKRLRLVALRPVGSAYAPDEHRVFCQDGSQLLQHLGPQQGRLVYIDPPYNHRQYSSNYHILETIARWDLGSFEPRGTTGLRPSGEQRSAFCVRSIIEDAFRQLFGLVQAEYLLFSYNNEGLLSEEALRGLFAEVCSEVTFEHIPFKRFRADIDRVNRVYKANATREFLVLGRLRQQAAPVEAGTLHTQQTNGAAPTTAATPEARSLRG